MNWDEAEASRVTAPPGIRPVPWTVNGSVPRPSSSTGAPRARSASSTGPIGRTRACASPSNVTGPSASAATGGRKRITVPARPQSTWAPPRRVAGVTTQSARSAVVRRRCPRPARPGRAGPAP